MPGPDDRAAAIAASPERRAVLAHVADRVEALELGHPARVGVDGVDAAGKSWFAEELAQVLIGRGRRVIRASLDGFHHPEVIRYRLGRDSPDGYFLDSFDYGGLKEALLEPLSPGGSGAYHTAIFDYREDAPAFSPMHDADPRDILVFDGVFLMCQELRRLWDLVVFLDVDFRASVARLVERDHRLHSPDPDASANRRYVEGQRRYLRECDPAHHAHVVIDNVDLANPRILAER
jgi:uridine kinase